MLIHTMDIRQYTTSSMILTQDNIEHQKSLPVLSVVQSIEGSYEIGIDANAKKSTGKMGAFIAPSSKMQHITHHLEPDTGIFRAHWIFLDVLVNQQFRLDDVYEFPLLLPEQFNQTLYILLKSIASTDNLCSNLSDIYKLIGILLDIGTPKPTINHFVAEVELYINQHYKEKITDDQLCAQFLISKPTLYRKFQYYFHMSPANYINSIRLSKSIILLENTDLPLYSICDEIGIHDVFYYSKLFKQKYGLPPSLYQKQYRNNQI